MHRSGNQDVLFNTVAMMRMRSKRSVLLTESDRDTDLYKKFVDENRCLVRAAGNRDAVINMLERFASNRILGVAGIIDTDSDHALGRPNPRADIARTPCSDKETTIIDSPDFERFCHQLNPLLDPVNLRQEIYASTLPLGILRRVSAREGWKIDFKSIEFRHFLDATSRCDKNRCCELVVAANQHLDISTRQMQAALDDEACNLLHPAHVIQGHDIVEVLALRSRAIFGRPVIGHEIEKNLSDAYSRQEFEKTSTYGELKAIEAAAPPQFEIFGQ
jgi:hypothetical protein